MSTTAAPARANGRVTTFSKLGVLSGVVVAVTLGLITVNPIAAAGVLAAGYLLVLLVAYRYWNAFLDGMTALRHIAAGNTSVSINSSRTDTLGEFHATVESISDELEETSDTLLTTEKKLYRLQRDVERNLGEFQRIVAESLEKGRIDRRLHPQSEVDEVEALASEYNDLMGAIQNYIAHVRQFGRSVDVATSRTSTSVHEVQLASEHIAETTQEIADGATHQLKQLDETGAEIDELLDSIDAVRVSADRLTKSADRSGQLGREGQKYARAAGKSLMRIESWTDHVEAAVADLDEQLGEIDKVVNSLNKMASEADMLGINANIEASRSLGSNSGLGVVGKEVRAFADETEQRASQIEATLSDLRTRASETTDEISEARTEVSHSTDTIKGALQVLDAITGQIEAQNDSIDEIGRLTSAQEEKSRDVARVVDRVMYIADNIAVQTENVAAASEEQLANLTHVDDLVSKLDVGAGQLVSRLEGIKLDDEIDVTTEKPRLIEAPGEIEDVPEVDVADVWTALAKDQS